MYKILSVAALLLCVGALVTADDNGCGGLLQGEYGRYQYPVSQSKHVSSVSSCLWTIQLPSGSDIRFTLDTFDSESQLVLYPEQNPTRRSLSSVRLNSSDVGTSVEFKGRTLIVILPNTDSTLSFTWESLSENSENGVVAANYIDAAEGVLEWRQRRRSERLTCAISAHDSTVISWRTTVESYSCDSEDPCQCLYLGIFEVAPSGSLVEAGRLCGKTSSEGTHETSSSQMVAFAFTNMVEHSALNKLEISWQSQPSGTTDTTTSTTTTTSTSATTSTTTTELPPDFTVGILAATSSGLVAISLDTLNSTVISSANMIGVGFDTKTSKAIWSEQSGTMKRAYVNGTETEVLKTGAGLIHGITIDVLTGNVYYANYSGSQIMVCNREVQNCVTLATAPIVDGPISIAVHFQQRQIYWTNRGTFKSIVKANLDGSNATPIVVGLDRPAGIVVDSDAGKIYWADEDRKVIHTSDLEGGDRRILVELSASSGPFGIVIHRNLLYIGNWAARSIQSVDKNTGADLNTVYSISGNVREITIFDFTTARCHASKDNPCEGYRCSHVCVPTITSYRCLCPKGMHLGGNNMTCLYSK